MTNNRIDEKGFWSTKGDGVTTSNLVLTGTVSANVDANFTSLSRLAKYEGYVATGSQAISGDGVHFIYRVNGLAQSASNQLSYWNNSQHYLSFSAGDLGKVFLLRINGILSASSGNPTVHFDFKQKDGGDGGIHADPDSLIRQSFDVRVVHSTGLDHSHFLNTFLFSVDETLVLSGAQIYVATDSNATVTLKSSSLFLSEV